MAKKQKYLMEFIREIGGVMPAESGQIAIIPLPRLSAENLSMWQAVKLLMFTNTQITGLCKRINP